MSLDLKRNSNNYPVNNRQNPGQGKFFVIVFSATYGGLQHMAFVINRFLLFRRTKGLIKMPPCALSAEAVGAGFCGTRVHVQEDICT
jgi:hypothetical protein